MRIETTFLRSRLGRRMLQLFVLSALIPVGLLAGISLWRVGRQLDEQDRAELRQASHEEGLAICERFSFLEADLKLTASRLQAGIGLPRAMVGSPSNAARRFLGMEVVGPDGSSKALVGDETWKFDVTPDERSHLRSGRALVATRLCGESQPCIFIAVEANENRPEHGFVVGKVSPAYLLDAEDLPENKSICVLDEQDRVLMCSGEIPSASYFRALGANSGEFQWTGERGPYEADYWNLFIKPALFANHWTVIASEAQRDRLLPLTQFKKIFYLIVLLSLLVVGLATLTQIRRQMRPLGKLQEGTRQIAAGSFDSRVSVQSGDEFEELANSFNSMATRIEKQFNTLKTNNVIDRAILSAWDIEQIVATLLAHVRSVLPYEAVCVSILETGETLRVKNYVSSAGCESNPKTTVVAFGEKSMQELSSHTGIATLCVTGRSPEFLVPLTSCGMRYFLIAPIVVQGKLSAMVSLGHSARSIWKDEDCSQAQQIADRVGVALANARLVQDLQLLHLGTLTALARAIDAKSHWTSGHSERVTYLALRVAMEMGLSPRDQDIVRRGGLLHDIGKIGISGEILDKPGRLTPEELAQVQEHVEIGRRILEPIPGFADCIPVILQHHERFDGAGYPNGLAGSEISIHARIFAVADFYDAIVSDRPYRPGVTTDRAIEMLKEGSGNQFDPGVVESFLRVVSRDQEVAVQQNVPETPVAVV